MTQYSSIHCNENHDFDDSEFEEELAGLEAFLDDFNRGLDDDEEELHQIAHGLRPPVNRELFPINEASED